MHPCHATFVTHGLVTGKLLKRRQVQREQFHRTVSDLELFPSSSTTTKSGHTGVCVHSTETCQTGEFSTWMAQL